MFDNWFFGGKEEIWTYGVMSTPYAWRASKAKGKLEKVIANDISRFSDAKKYSAYAGLVPCVQISDRLARYGHITKRGPIELRTAFVQVVKEMVRLQKKTEAY